MKKGALSTILVSAALLAIIAYIIFAKPSISAAPAQEGTTEKPLHERVLVAAPESGATVAHTFTVSGEAPGNWYFEASFPIEVRDTSGNTLAQTHASALSDWMTTEQVAFSAAVTIDSGYTGAATLVLHKDNPSGLLEHDDSLEIPIVIQ